ncbi:MAG: DNA repair protein RecO [Alphaproteobacteria bacterium]|nr:DNA repair protein RecO [Alphaproteobacteria bacterium]
MSQTLSDLGFILSISEKENGFLMTLFSEKYGKISGFSKISKKDHAHFQPGNLVTFSHYARLEEHLGTFKIDLEQSFQDTFLFQKEKSNLSFLILNLIFYGLEERTVYPLLFEKLKKIFFSWKQENTHPLKDYFLFEKAFLQDTGFGFNLTQCAITGTKKNLIYISPKTGQCASQEAGEKYKDKLLPLPQFFIKDGTHFSQKEQKEARDTLVFFLSKYFSMQLKSFLQKREKFLSYLD